MENLYRLISDEWANVIKSRLCLDKLTELRIRNNMPLRVGYDNAYYYLRESGLAKCCENVFVVGQAEVHNVVMRACNHSIYAVEQTLKSGYISVDGGIRIGVCGSYITNDVGKIVLKNFSSVNIRIPHAVIDCASPIVNKLYGDNCELLNTLIISPPGVGKTTILRDLCRLLAKNGKNILVCDEKYEIAAMINGVSTLDVGNVDVVCGRTKSEVIDIAITVMRPDIIFMDELSHVDVDGVLRASHCGLVIVATVHANDVNDFKNKVEFKNLIMQRIFKRYVVLSKLPYKHIAVYDGDGEEVI